MKNRMRKIAGMIACAAMVVTGVPVLQPEAVQAATEEPIQVGDNVYAELDDYGTMTISGEGEMWENNHFGTESDSGYRDYGENVFCQWFGEYEDELNAVVFQEGVTTVGKNAFVVCCQGKDDFHYYSHRRGLSALTSVKLSSTIETICESAFCGAPVLKSITIPGNVKTIEAGAFSGSGLASVKLNEGLETIGEFAFASTDLTGVNIPGSVKSVESYAFYSSTLSNVTINPGTKVIKKGAFNDVTAKFYNKNIVIMEGAFGTGSKFICYKGSTADTYAKNHGITVKYISSKPSKAKKPTVSSKNKKLYITCKTMAGVDGYRIRYSTNKSMKKAEGAFGRQLIVSGLKKGKKYYVQVCAYKVSNGKRVYGAWSDTVTVKIK